MQALSAALYVLAYILAVVDGTRQRLGGFWGQENEPPMGLRAYAQRHPWIIAGAACGIAGVVVDFAT
jgi:hypothetical protein